MLDILTSWLESHSTSIVRDSNETRFIHRTGSTSILVHRAEWIKSTVPLKGGLLQQFYSKYWAASIGDGHIVIGTPVVGGITVSHGYRVPDLDEMSKTAHRLGLPEDTNLEVFMQQASWMFIYGIPLRSNSLVLFDRDFLKLRSLSGIEAVLNQWWEIELADYLPTSLSKDESQAAE